MIPVFKYSNKLRENENYKKKCYCFACLLNIFYFLKTLLLLNYIHSIFVDIF